MLRAFARGRRSRSLYGEAFEPLLSRPLGELRRERLPGGDGGPGAAIPLSAGDLALFVPTALAGLVVGLLFMALLVPLVPFGLMAVRKARQAKAAAAS